MQKTAVLLMDYGAPTCDAEVRPFIASVLKEPRVLGLPWGARQLLATYISVRRASKVRERYTAIGGSPLPQAVQALANQLEMGLGPEFSVRPAYCHANPKIGYIVEQLAKEGITRVIGLPLFPQRSWTTSDVCQQQLVKASKHHGLECEWVPEYPTELGLIAAHHQHIMPLLNPQTHVLMVAHGLPKRLEDAGDTYPSRIRMTANAIAAKLPEGQSWSLAFQSRVGKAEWTGPYLNDEISRLANDGVKEIAFIALSFATENLEVCWDLDREALGTANSLGIERVVRSPQPSTHPQFQQLLKELVQGAIERAGWRADRCAQ